MGWTTNKNKRTKDSGETLAETCSPGFFSVIFVFYFLVFCCFMFLCVFECWFCYFEFFLFVCMFLLRASVRTPGNSLFFSLRVLACVVFAHMLDATQLRTHVPCYATACPRIFRILHGWGGLKGMNTYNVTGWFWGQLFGMAFILMFF